MLHGGESVDDGLAAEQQRAVGDGAAVAGEEPQHGPGEQDAAGRHRQRVEQHDAACLPHPLPDPGILPGGGVLGDEKDQGLGEAVDRHQQQAGHLVGAGKAGDGRHPDAPQQPLLDHAGHRRAGLLDGAGGRQPEHLPQAAAVQHGKAERPGQQSAAQIPQHEQAPRHLGEGGGRRRARHPEGPHPGEVQQDVQHRGGQHGVQGRFRVAAGHHQLFGQVVDHQEGQPRQVKADVLRRLGQDLGGGADQAQQPFRPCQPGPRHAQPQHRVDGQQVVDRRRQLFRGGGGPPGGQQQAAAQLHPARYKEEHHQHRGCVGHRRQGARVQAQPHDHGVGHRIELGGHHRQDDGPRKAQQRRAHRPGQQGVFGLWFVLRHGFTFRLQNGVDSGMLGLS